MVVASVSRLDPFLQETGKSNHFQINSAQFTTNGFETC